MAKKTSVANSKKVVAEIVDVQLKSKKAQKSDNKKSDKKVTVEKLSPTEPDLIDDDLLLESPEVVVSKAPQLTSSSKSVATVDPITSYLNEIKKYPLLTREQEFELAKRYYETKDPAAAQSLVTSNLRFVVKVAAEYSKFGAKLIDLVQEGNMGLMHAVREFNPYKGTRLITYAVWWIKGYIQEYMMKQYSLVKIGTTQTQKKLFYKLQKEKDLLEKMGQGSDLKLIAEKLGVEESEIESMAQRLSGRDASLNQTLDEDSGTSLMDFQRSAVTSPDDLISQNEEREKLLETIEELKSELNDKEKLLLQERLLNDEPMTLQEIGDKWGTTREAVRQMEARLMKKIRERLTSIR